ncbi:MAG: folate-binding protein [Hyphomicrobium sp.]
MPAAQLARLADRGVVRVRGRDSEKLLQDLVTNDLDRLAPNAARYAGLLSPQGKILFDFFVVRHGDGFLLDVARAKTVELTKRLTMYKLRADVEITDVSESFTAFAAWGTDSEKLIEGRDITFADPRHAALGLRLLDEIKGDGARPLTENDSQQSYDSHRVEIGVPEGGKDYEFGDAYPHEADFDLFNGVSFTKGCFVGQEIVARMQNKSVVRKRAIRISGSAPLTSRLEILLGSIAVGMIGTVDGSNAIAMLRLDRAVEAEQKNQKLTAGGVIVTPDEEALARYRASAAARPSTALPAP